MRAVSLQLETPGGAVEGPRRANARKMSGFPANGNISAEPGDALCFNCEGAGWVTVRIPVRKRSKVEPSGARSYPNRIECPICSGSGIKSKRWDGVQRRFEF